MKLLFLSLASEAPTTQVIVKHMLSKLDSNGNGNDKDNAHGDDRELPSFTLPVHDTVIDLDELATFLEEHAASEEEV